MIHTGWTLLTDIMVQFLVAQLGWGRVIGEAIPWKTWCQLTVSSTNRICTAWKYTHNTHTYIHIYIHIYIYIYIYTHTYYIHTYIPHTHTQVQELITFQGSFQYSNIINNTSNMVAKLISWPYFTERPCFPPVISRLYWLSLARFQLKGDNLTGNGSHQ